MRQQFERAGVWDLMRKRIPAATYTGAGDPLRIDCGYRPNGVIRMFHAVSLESDVELAKVLAFSMPALREGVSRLDGASLQLTAVVEPQPGTQADEEKQQEYEFAIRTMEKESILVVNSMEMERVAEAARRELRV
jgi:hypothetical protein